MAARTAIFKFNINLIAGCKHKMAAGLMTSILKPTKLWLLDANKGAI
jgi:hypothetical protein